MNAEKVQSAVVVNPKSLLQDDIDLSGVDIPTSESGRALLRAQLEKELLSMKQEQVVLKRCSESSEAPTSVKQVTKMLIGRAKALNPVRDFHEVGFTLINDGENPWEYCECGHPLAWGILAPLVSGLATGFITSDVPLAIGVGVFAAAPVFLSTWGLRTAYNLAAGLVAAVAAPFAYAGARMMDIRRHPGCLTAKEFLSDLENSPLDKTEQAEMIGKREALLEKHIAGREKLLSQVEAPIVAREKTRLGAKWLSGLGAAKNRSRSGNGENG